MAEQRRYISLGRAFVSDDFTTLIIAEQSVGAHVPAESIRVPIPEHLVERFRQAAAETA